MKARVLLIDDHPLFVDGFAMMLRQAKPDWTLESASSAAEALFLLRQGLDFDLIIVDVQLPEHDGFETLGLIAEFCPSAPRMMMSGREDGLAQLRAQQAGARGFVVKASPPETILATIDGVLAGQPHFARGYGSGDATPSLSPRQTEVMELLATGCANKEIRYRLNIAERTVRAHLTEIFNALGVNSRVQAILRARELGLLE
jgi:DNA-binding NarL/FixJ family response regulator